MDTSTRAGRQDALPGRRDEEGRPGRHPDSRSTSVKLSGFHICDAGIMWLVFIRHRRVRVIGTQERVRQGHDKRQHSKR